MEEVNRRRWTVLQVQVGELHLWRLSQSSSPRKCRFHLGFSLDVSEWLSERTLRPRWNKVKCMVAPWAASLSQNAAKYAIIDLGQATNAWG